MLIFTNLEPTSTFSIFLEGKIVEPLKPLFLFLRRQADLKDYVFLLADESTSINYSTFTIDATELPKGDYDARIYNGDFVPGTVQDCFIEAPLLIENPEFFLCDPATLETTIILESIMTVGVGGTPAGVIMTAKARVFGTEETFYTNTIVNNYTVYES
jgi:hypothetical protein